MGFFLDMGRCTGCRTCQVACAQRNRLPAGVSFRRAATYSVGAFPDVQAYSLSTGCHHCARPACLAACPAGAYRVERDGTVQLDAASCVGCGACVRACPFDAVVMLPEGVAGKCDACAPLRAEGQPCACVAACPTRALDFGDEEELRRRHGAGLVSTVAALPRADTCPTTLFRAKAAALRDGAREVGW